MWTISCASPRKPPTPVVPRTGNTGSQTPAARLAGNSGLVVGNLGSKRGLWCNKYSGGMALYRILENGNLVQDVASFTGALLLWNENRIQRTVWTLGASREAGGLVPKLQIPKEELIEALRLDGIPENP